MSGLEDRVAVLEAAVAALAGRPLAGDMLKRIGNEIDVMAARMRLSVPHSRPDASDHDRGAQAGYLQALEEVGNLVAELRSAVR